MSSRNFPQQPVETVSHTVSCHNVLNMDNASPFFDAIRDNDLDAIRSLATMYPAMLNESYYRPGNLPDMLYSPLACALGPGHNGGSWQLLLSLGANPTLHDGDHNPIIQAILYDVTEFLAVADFDPLRPYRGFRGENEIEGVTNHMMACGDREGFRAYYRFRRDRIERKFVPLRFAFEEGRAESSLVLLKRVAATAGSSFNPNLAWHSVNFFQSDQEHGIASYQRDAKFPDGEFPEQTLLYRAAFSGMDAALKLLLEMGADPLLRNQAGQTLLHAAVFGACNCIRYRRNASYPPRDYTVDRSVFRPEVGEAYSNVCESLLDAGVDPKITDALHRSPLDFIDGAHAGPFAPYLSRPIKRVLRLKTTVEILTRASTRRNESPFFKLLGVDGTALVFAAIDPNYKRLCGLPLA